MEMSWEQMHWKFLFILVNQFVEVVNVNEPIKNNNNNNLQRSSFSAKYLVKHYIFHYASFPNLVI